MAATMIQPTPLNEEHLSQGALDKAELCACRRRLENIKTMFENAELISFEIIPIHRIIDRDGTEYKLRYQAATDAQGVSQTIQISFPVQPSMPGDRFTISIAERAGHHALSVSDTVMMDGSNQINPDTSTDQIIAIIDRWLKLIDQPILRPMATNFPTGSPAIEAAVVQQTQAAKRLVQRIISKLIHASGDWGYKSLATTFTVTFSGRYHPPKVAAEFAEGEAINQILTDDAALNLGNRLPSIIRLRSNTQHHIVEYKFEPLTSLGFTLLDQESVVNDSLAIPDFPDNSLIPSFDEMPH